MLAFKAKHASPIASLGLNDHWRKFQRYEFWQRIHHAEVSCP
ncbi:MAG: hypothetical protein N3B10_06450 [Armatimonadetes bacterium]|nr:hypothetical protein [Armatimonadota bacterium]MCX7968117.1 hypothetical protein [Armatimonadota bacterium]MDW8143145.1 hypothetical protein [Armatimonadota bacterium]